MSFGGSVKPTQYIFLEGENNLINDVCELTDYAKNGSSWLNLVCTQVDYLVDVAGWAKVQDRIYTADLESYIRFYDYATKLKLTTVKINDMIIL